VRTFPAIGLQRMGACTLGSLQVWEAPGLCLLVSWAGPLGHFAGRSSGWSASAHDCWASEVGGS
jgi:hypothetical protein